MNLRTASCTEIHFSEVLTLVRKFRGNRYNLSFRRAVVTH